MSQTALQRALTRAVVFLAVGLLVAVAGWSACAAPEHVRILDNVLAGMRRYYWDTNYRGLDWKKLSDETRVKVQEAPDIDRAMAEVRALLAQLDDHHTFLESPNTNDTGAVDTYAGIGCLLSLKAAEGYCLISDVFPGTPAEGAGLRKGDRIWAVDGKPVSDFVTEKNHPANAIRGVIGTRVTLLVEKAGGDKVELSVERRQIVHEKKVEFRRVGDAQEYGYIQFENFYDQVSKQVLSALRDLQDTKGLILDLRDDPGGLIRELVQIAAYLGMPDLGKAVSRDSTTRYRTMWVPSVYTKPMVILVNGGTASSAEILSTVAKESKRAVLVGEPTSNGTAVAVNLDAGSGYSISITTAQFFTPQGHPYQAPTQPDVALAALTEADIRADKDVWLDQAVIILRDRVMDSVGQPVGLDLRPAA